MRQQHWLLLFNADDAKPLRPYARERHTLVGNKLPTWQDPQQGVGYNLLVRELEFTSVLYDQPSIRLLESVWRCPVRHLVVLLNLQNRPDTGAIAILVCIAPEQAVNLEFTLEPLITLLKTRWKHISHAKFPGASEGAFPVDKAFLQPAQQRQSETTTWQHMFWKRKLAGTLTRWLPLAALRTGLGT